MMNSAPSQDRASSQRLSQRKIACEHCGETIGTCYGERVLAVGSAHFLKLTIMQCAKCGFQIRWAPGVREMLEAVS